MSCFPLFINLKGKNVYLIGAGSVALEKARRILPFEPELTVISKTFLPEFSALPNVRCIQKEFVMEDLQGADLVLSATGDENVAQAIFSWCEVNRIPVNTADCKAYCSFLFPALVHRDPLCIGISTDGASPVAASYLKKEIDEMIPDCFPSVLEWLMQERPVILERFSSQSVRGQIFSTLFAQALKNKGPLSTSQTERILQDFEQDR